MLTPRVLERQLQDEGLWQLLLMASKNVAAIVRAVASGEPANLAKYAFQLAQSFSEFYHGHPILKESDPEKAGAFALLAAELPQPVAGHVGRAGHRSARVHVSGNARLTPYFGWAATVGVERARRVKETACVF
ncbi:MAG: DALR anticodon-binding domain-containing protein [Bryobacterales bacterium]|nr:DALR anticodon-binding domain-containing protein [Bryobacterales bacterium]